MKSLISDLRAAMKKDFHEPDNALVMDLDPWDGSRARPHSDSVVKCCSERTTYLYDIMDAAYDAASIREVSIEMNLEHLFIRRVPLPRVPPGTGAREQP